MHTVEVVRSGDRPIGDQLAEMQAWLARAGIAVLSLEPIDVMQARVRFRASFANAADAERFRRRFDIGAGGGLG